MRNIIIFTTPTPVFIAVPIDIFERLFREGRHLKMIVDNSDLFYENTNLLQIKKNKVVYN